MLKPPTPLHTAALMAALAMAGCMAPEPRTGASAPRAEAMPVQAALIFSGPFRWVERDKAFEVAGARGPLGLDKPLRPLATLNWPNCPKGGMSNLRDSAPVICQAKVKFGIDAEGRANNVQLLHAAQSANVAPTFNFGFNVVTTVNQWRFEPPLRGGKPADICCVELSID